MARVGDRLIATRELEAAVARGPGGDRGADAYRAQLGRMIDGVILEREAAALGLLERPDVVARREVIRERARRAESDLLRTVIREHLEASTKVTEGELQEFYARVKGRFLTSRLHLRRLLVADEQDALRAKARIDAGEDFGAVAAEVSMDAALRERHGELGVLERTQIPEGLRARALMLERPGQVSDPFEAGGGWNLLQLASIQRDVERSFEDVRPQLERELRRAKLSQALRQLLDERRAELGVEVDEAVLEQLAGAAEPTARRLSRSVSLAGPEEARERGGH